jgi:hypothetical protein
MRVRSFREDYYFNVAGCILDIVNFTWSRFSQQVTETPLLVVPRKFQALHADGFRGIKVLSQWRYISL